MKLAMPQSSRLRLNGTCSLLLHLKAGSLAPIVYFVSLQSTFKPFITPVSLTKNHSTHVHIPTFEVPACLNSRFSDWVRDNGR